MTNRTIKIDYLARVEGEGALYVKLKDGQVADVQLKIFEPPRFFEAFLRGRHYSEAPDITARICGICPVAYQMSAVHALEAALGVRVDGQLRALRRLIYCGEWIESHALHIFMLHAPDFLGYPDAIAMASDHREVVEMGLKLKKAGNQIVTEIGGREIHPVNVRVGGFYRVPPRYELAGLRESIVTARDLAEETVRWTAALPTPEFEQEYRFVSLSHPEEYPFNEGRIVSSEGLDIPAAEYEQHFSESHVAYTNALHSLMADGGNYLVGPLARFNLNFEKLPEGVRELAREVGVIPPVRNPFRSIVVRALETLFACEEALRVIDRYEQPPMPSVEVPVRAARGCAATEAPRGLLYHSYEIDDEGAILQARIVPPTSQNQKTIEEDLRRLIPARIDLPRARLVHECEQAIRNYDPCISCATHFLDLRVEGE